jgi:hypothetical protein
MPGRPPQHERRRYRDTSVPAAEEEIQMFTAMGPALDAELSYRRETLAGCPRPRRAWWRRRRAVSPVPAVARWPFGALVEMGPAPERPARKESSARADHAA